MVRDPRGRIIYSKVEGRQNIADRLRVLTQLVGQKIKDCVFINGNGQCEYYNEGQNQELPPIALEGEVDKTIRNTIFGVGLILYTDAGKEYMQRMIGIAKGSGYMTNPMG